MCILRNYIYNKNKLKHWNQECRLTMLISEFDSYILQSGEKSKHQTNNIIKKKKPNNLEYNDHQNIKTFHTCFMNSFLFYCFSPVLDYY